MYQRQFRPNIYDMHEEILSHTALLLQSGVFNHLKDEAISLLHHNLLMARGNAINTNPFFVIWRKGDFSGSLSCLELLHQSNRLLQKYGQRPIEVDFLENVID